MCNKIETKRERHNKRRKKMSIKLMEKQKKRTNYN